MRTSPNVVKDIVENHETPFFLYDSEEIRKSVSELRGALHHQVDVFYSFKANPNISICALMLREGVHAEVSSWCELKLADQIGFKGVNIIFVGPGKTERELELAVRLGVFAIVVENSREIELISSVCEKLNKRARVALRINPPFQNKSAPLKMGGVGTQFGLDLSVILKHKEWFQNTSIDLIGLHIYNGTRILEAHSIVENCSKIFSLVREICEQIPLDLEILGLGGGFGVPYFENEISLDLSSLNSGVRDELLEFKRDFPAARLIAESGRFLVARSGCLFLKVLYVKESYGKTFAVTDGGMNCHMAATGVGSFLRRNFPITRLRPALENEKLEPYTLTGPLCTPSDLIGQDVLLPSLAPGDTIQVGMSGA